MGRRLRPRAPDSGHYGVASDRGGERAAAIYTLIVTALCRARHKAVYAARRTMPNGLVFPKIRGDRDVIRSA
jgi:transposase